MIYQGNDEYLVTEIIIHCAATRKKWMEHARTSQKVAEIRRWHVEERGWRDIGYHWIIDRDGTVAQGRKENVMGAHVAGHNRGTIGISLIGGHGASTTDAFKDNFTEAQDHALRRLITLIKERTAIQKVKGHNDYAAKACPGFDVKAWLEAAPL